MAYNRTQAAKLLTEAEMTVYKASLADEIRNLTVSQLNAKIKRARTLRDKFRDLLRRQKVGTRSRTGSKSGLRGNANERTAQKVEVFEQVLERLGTRLPQLEAANERAAKKAAALKAPAKKALAKKTSAKKAPAKKAPAKKAAATKAPAKNSSAKKAPAKKVVAAKNTASKKRSPAKSTPGRPASRQAATSDKAPAKKPATARGSTGPGSESARGAGRAQQLQSSRSRVIQAHIRSGGRRNQSKRDSRG